jgi:D-alanine-D-alanine ligase
VNLALLFNERPLDTHGAPDDAFEEFDPPETIGALAAALARLGEITPLPADRDLARRLSEGRFDFAFNIAEGFGRRCREAHAAAVCEMLGVPYTHSDPLTLGLTLDKMLARRVVSPDVPVARAVLVDGWEHDDALDAFRYPAVVKPNDEGSSKGIHDDSLACGPGEARRLVERLRDLYECPVLVEQYLPGPEVTVGVMGNGRTVRILGVMEIAPAAPNGVFLYSVEAKRNFRERVRYFIPPRVPEPVVREIGRLALTAYRLLGCRDVARLDFRLDAEGRPRFLECNPLPGLSPDTSDIVILSAPSLSYPDLVCGVFREAALRHGWEVP